jgi:hypothetical protein
MNNQLAYDILSGRDDTIEFEDYLGDIASFDTVEIHEKMEKYLKIQ